MHVIYISKRLSSAATGTFSGLPCCKKADMVKDFRVEANTGSPQELLLLERPNQQYCDFKQIEQKAQKVLKQNTCILE
jgi:hypothetical protein